MEEDVSPSPSSAGSSSDGPTRRVLLSRPSGGGKRRISLLRPRKSRPRKLVTVNPVPKDCSNSPSSPIPATSPASPAQIFVIPSSSSSASSPVVLTSSTPSSPKKPLLSTSSSLSRIIVVSDRKKGLLGKGGERGRGGGRSIAARSVAFSSAPVRSSSTASAGGRRPRLSRSNLHSRTSTRLLLPSTFAASSPTSSSSSSIFSSSRTGAPIVRIRPDEVLSRAQNPESLDFVFEFLEKGKRVLAAAARGATTTRPRQQLRDLRKLRSVLKRGAETSNTDHFLLSFFVGEHNGNSNSSGKNLRSSNDGGSQQQQQQHQRGGIHVLWGLMLHVLHSGGIHFVIEEEKQDPVEEEEKTQDGQEKKEEQQQEEEEDVAGDGDGGGSGGPLSSIKQQQRLQQKLRQPGQPKIHRRSLLRSTGTSKKRSLLLSKRRPPASTPVVIASTKNITIVTTRGSSRNLRSTSRVSLLNSYSKKKTSTPTAGGIIGRGGRKKGGGKHRMMRLQVKMYSELLVQCLQACVACPAGILAIGRHTDWVRFLVGSLSREDMFDLFGAKVMRVPVLQILGRVVRPVVGDMDRTILLQKQKKKQKKQKKKKLQEEKKKKKKNEEVEEEEEEEEEEGEVDSTKQGNTSSSETEDDDDFDDETEEEESESEEQEEQQNDHTLQTLRRRLSLVSRLIDETPIRVQDLLNVSYASYDVAYVRCLIEFLFRLTRGTATTGVPFAQCLSILKNIRDFFRKGEGSKILEILRRKVVEEEEMEEEEEEEQQGTTSQSQLHLRFFELVIRTVGSLLAADDDSPSSSPLVGDVGGHGEEAAVLVAGSGTTTTTITTGDGTMMKRGDDDDGDGTAASSLISVAVGGAATAVSSASGGDIAATATTGLLSSASSSSIHEAYSKQAEEARELSKGYFSLLSALVDILSDTHVSVPSDRILMALRHLQESSHHLSPDLSGRAALVLEDLQAEALAREEERQRREEAMKARGLRFQSRQGRVEGTLSRGPPAIVRRSQDVASLCEDPVALKERLWSANSNPNAMMGMRMGMEEEEEEEGERRTMNRFVVGGSLHSEPVLSSGEGGVGVAAESSSSSPDSKSSTAVPGSDDDSESTSSQGQHAPSSDETLEQPSAEDDDDSSTPTPSSSPVDPDNDSDLLLAPPDADDLLLAPPDGLLAPPPGSDGLLCPPGGGGGGGGGRRRVRPKREKDRVYLKTKRSAIDVTDESVFADVDLIEKSIDFLRESDFMSESLPYFKRRTRKRANSVCVRLRSFFSDGNKARNITILLQKLKMDGKLDSFMDALATFNEDGVDSFVVTSLFHLFPTEKDLKAMLAYSGSGPLHEADAFIRDLCECVPAARQKLECWLFLNEAREMLEVADDCLSMLEEGCGIVLRTAPFHTFIRFLKGSCDMLSYNPKSDAGLDLFSAFSEATIRRQGKTSLLQLLVEHLMNHGYSDVCEDMVDSMIEPLELLGNVNCVETEQFVHSATTSYRKYRGIVEDLPDRQGPFVTKALAEQSVLGRRVASIEERMAETNAMGDRMQSLLTIKLDEIRSGTFLSKLYEFLVEVRTHVYHMRKARKFAAVLERNQSLSGLHQHGGVGGDHEEVEGEIMVAVPSVSGDVHDYDEMSDGELTLQSLLFQG